MALSHEASSSAGRCLEVFYIEGHEDAANLFLKCLRESAEGDGPDLDGTSDFEMRMGARIYGLAPRTRFKRGDGVKTEAILREIERTARRADDPKSTLIDAVEKIYAREPIRQLGRMALLLRALSDKDVFEAVTPGRPNQTGETLAAAWKKTRAAEKRCSPPKPPRAPKAPPPRLADVPSVPLDARGFGERMAADPDTIRVTPLSADRQPHATKGQTADPELEHRDLLYDAANAAIVEMGGTRLKKGALHALKALHEGHLVYRSSDDVFHIMICTLHMDGEAIVDVGASRVSNRYRAPCRDDHWEDIPSSWIGDLYREQHLSLYGVRKAIEIFGPIYTPIVAVDPTADDEDDAGPLDGRIRIVYPAGWTGQRVALPTVDLQDLPTEKPSRE